MQQVLEERSEAEVLAFVVWQPILATDWARPGSSVLERITDHRAAQYWDEDHLVARALAAAIAADRAHPEPDCCLTNDILWDLVAVYPPGGRWQEKLPRAEFIGGPVWTKAAALHQRLEPSEKSGNHEP